jgi:hypothetical protein
MGKRGLFTGKNYYSLEAKLFINNFQMISKKFLANFGLTADTLALKKVLPSKLFNCVFEFSNIFTAENTVSLSLKGT